MTWTSDEFPGTSLDAKWAWVNQGSATASVQNGQLVLSGPSQGGDQVRFLKQAYSGSLVVTFALTGLSKTFTDFQQWGIGVRDSSSGKLLLLNWVVSSGAASVDCLTVQRFNSATSQNSTQKVLNLADLGGYLQVEDDGTNLIFRLGRFGSQGDAGVLTFIEVYRETRAAWLSAADEIGVDINALNADTTLLCRWARTGTGIADTEVLAP